MAINYKLKVPLDTLPPPDFEVKKITTNPQVLDLPRDFLAVAVDTQINNNGGSDATVKINDKTTFTLVNGGSQQINGSLVYYIEISGITNADILLQIYKISELQKLGALEIC